MPYIKQVIRDELKDPECQPMNPGELAYVLTVIVKSYIKAHGELSFTLLNEVHGVLHTVDLELWRRTTSPYEDLKRRDNGDVQPCV